MSCLTDLGEGDIGELAADVEMKKGHAKKLKSSWKKAFNKA